METKGFGKARVMFEVRVVYNKSSLTMPTGDPFDDLKSAEKEARELHAEDGRHYKVTEITSRVVFRINSN